MGQKTKQWSTSSRMNGAAVKAMADPVRRALIGGIGATGSAAVGGSGWTLSSPMVPSGSMDGADVARGHRLRSGDFPAPAAIEEAEIVIAGGGIADRKSTRLNSSH